MLSVLTTIVPVILSQIPLAWSNGENRLICILCYSLISVHCIHPGLGLVHTIECSLVWLYRVTTWNVLLNGINNLGGGGGYMLLTQK